MEVARADESPAESRRASHELSVVRPPPAMNHLLFPPRGAWRPTLTQVLSEPSFRSEFLGLEQPRESQQDYRKSMASLSTHLDQQIVQREYQKKRRDEAEKAVIRLRQQDEQAMELERAMEQRPAWTYCDPADYFERPKIDNTESLQYLKNEFLQGMYNTPVYKPPHWENNVHGGWNYFDRNLRGRSLDIFGEKPRELLGPTEKKFVDKLDRKLRRAQSLIAKDAFNGTHGHVKKALIEKNAEEFSALKKTKPAWQTQRVYTHEIFSEPAPYAPGDHPYETGLPVHIVQPERALSFERDYICGDAERKSFWVAPKPGALKGTTVRATHAKELLCPRGCRALLTEQRHTAMPFGKTLGR